MKMTTPPSNSDKSNILFKGKYFIVGSLFMLIGGLFAVVFVLHSDFKSISYYNQELIQSKAVVIDVSETNFSVSNNRILEYKYRFLEHDKTQIGFSYSYNSTINLKDTVRIEFVQNDLETSRIVGHLNAPYELYIGGFVLIFPLLGIGFILFHVKKGSII